MPDLEEARRVLRDVLGYPGFREGQEGVVGRLLEGRSVLAIFPTGGGKSLCYQLPALLLDGLTIVVSPLIALMKDQVDALARRGVVAARLDSSLDVAETRRAYDDLRAGRTRLLYVAPERLASERFLKALGGREIALLAVDEAHCISEWGHNFRPEYMKLAGLAGMLKVGRVLALTATATPSVALDIARAFGIDQPDVVRTSFHRPNLELHATPCYLEDRRGLLLDRLRSRPPGPSIVYVTQQKSAEEMAGFLAGEGFEAEAYHAGLDADRRHEVQERFMASRARIVVATIAFGMGIDKADIRSVYHVNLPKSLENYAQEIGRAGRDGEPARCELLACAEDVTTLENFTFGDTPTPEAIEGLLRDVLGRGPAFDVSVYDLSMDHDVRQLVLETLLTYLELDGIVEGTGASYAEYKFRPLRPLDRILAGSRGERLREAIAQAKFGRIWYTLDLGAAGRSRSKFAGLLADLELAGDLEVQAKGVRQGFRLRADQPDVERLRDAMTARFEVRERRDVERVRQVMEFATGSECLTRRLVAHFGQAMESDCGHCGRCLGAIPDRIEVIPPRRIEEEDREILSALRAERLKPLASPRQEARFLCGLTSPAASRARLGRHPLFGALADLPFERVLALVEARSA
jgi:ATP-dependent DNA helicase RecQ